MPRVAGTKVGVLVVDDSTICQELIRQALSRDPDLEVVGMCGNGREAVEHTRRLRPQVITMDVHMPVMDGLKAVEEIMREMPTPILVLTADPRHQAPELTCKALELGALALQIKPTVDAGSEAWDLAREVKLLSSIKVIRHIRGRLARNASMPLIQAMQPGADRAGPSLGLIAIGSSTGGPQVVHKLLSELPKDFPVPIALVQHINPSFAESLAAWLNSVSRLHVRLAEDDDELRPGEVLVAPAHHHMLIEAQGRVALRNGPNRDGHQPSVSHLLESAGRAFGRRALGVVLTGMGVDGADGLRALKAAGGRTLIQSQESCVVFGMPGAALATGAVDGVVHGPDLAQALVRLVKGK